MTRLTEGLPVGWIPEEVLVTSVGSDVVNHRCLGQSSFPLAVNTERMELEVTKPCLVPSSIVTFGFS